MAASINIPVYSDALVVLGTAGIIVPLAKRWGLNPVLGYFVAGALLGRWASAHSLARRRFSIGSRSWTPRTCRASPTSAWFSFCS
jgi:Kef-type K+ transport system membrane component KefB